MQAGEVVVMARAKIVVRPGLLVGIAALAAIALAGRGATGAQAAGGGFCTEVITPRTLQANTPIASVVGLVMGNFTVTSVFQYNNLHHAYDALYFNTAGAPVDATTVGPGQPIFICGTGTGTFPNGNY